MTLTSSSSMMVKGRMAGAVFVAEAAVAAGGRTSWTSSSVAGSMPACSAMKKVREAAYACPASGPGAPAAVEGMPAGPGPYTATGFRNP
ncbi:hypothetical protein SBI_08618 [Streptomyces bingchenggensis BCW-1]|uniref:Uncharacterized protein n=1 Tax=Streptomyces bingchenggensis (strain BCW-1) TaxID=749414 RepID=D7BW26_STRBB|nr:hypothetical protein SBI_08618 [Streptomyces bingchenggensis BCW-1]